jgi:tRNA1Val (adenine37-N6)-methyltransferase
MEPAQPRSTIAAARAGKTPTHDTLFGGRVALAQPPRGGAYRVNVDAVLLAAFAAGALVSDTRARRVRSARAAFDLGAGVGAVGLSLIHLGAAEHVTMLEVDASLAKLAESNAAANGWAARIEVVRADVSVLADLPAGAADLIVCNPPYVEPGRGRAPAPSRARARSGPLSVFLDAARRLAGRRARVCLVYPALETTTLLGELRTRGLEPKRLRAVHGRPEDRARVVLVECCAGRPGGLAIEPPLVETSADGPALLIDRDR